MITIPPAATKYKFEGIGKASATTVMVALVGTPYAFVTVGPVGQVIHFALTLVFMALASVGLVLANVGIAYAETMDEKHQFDLTFDDAFKTINEKGSSLTEEEKKKLDDQVIAAHNNFGTFRVRDS